MNAEKQLITVPASYEILTHLDEQSVLKGIEYCGRICYKSEEKITRKSAPVFCANMAEHGHNSVLEMRVQTFLAIMPIGDIEALINLMPKYLIIDEYNGYDSLSDSVRAILITGSIRAFREMAMMHPECFITTLIAQNLELAYPSLFGDINSNFRNINGWEKISPDSLREKLLSVSLEDLHDILWMQGLISDEIFLRHRHIAVKFIVNRAVTHEIVRHRPCSFLQESQRYCRYADDKFGNRVTFIEPMFFKKSSPEYEIWKEAMLLTEERYLELLKTSTPQAARTVLPNSCKTEIIVFANLVEWNHIFHMRTSKAAEPSMREVTIPLQKDFCEIFPGFEFNRRFPENFIE